MLTVVLLSVLGTVMVGVFLFWFRCHHRLWYGIGEVFAGIVVVVFVWVPHTDEPITTGDAEPVFWVRWTWLAVASLAGVYVFVRGLDSIGQDLPIAWRRVWDRFFT